MKINLGFFFAKFLKLINRPALRNCSIDRCAVVGSGSNCINVSMGKYSYTGKNVSMTNVCIGNFCSIASYSAIGGGDHPLNAVSTSTVFIKGHNIFGKSLANHTYDINKPVLIGNDVWIGEASFVSAGITIGDGAIIGAHSVVTHDVEPYMIVAGAPARTIRKRFDDDTIERLKELKWWNWPDEKIRKFSQYFENPYILLKKIEEDKR